MDVLSFVEKSVAPEGEVARVVGYAADWVERSLTAIYAPRIPQSRALMCGISSALVQRALERLGVKSDTYQLRDIHMKLLGETDKTIPFQHTVNITQGPGIPYLIDLTFCQFVTSEGLVVNNQGQECGRLDDPLAQEVMNKGYFSLTNDNLRALLKLTSPRRDEEYLQRINQVTLADLKIISPRVDVHDPAKLDSKFLDPFRSPY